MTGLFCGGGAFAQRIARLPGAFASALVRFGPDEIEGAIADFLGQLGEDLDADHVALVSTVDRAPLKSWARRGAEPPDFSRTRLLTTGTGICALTADGPGNNLPNAGDAVIIWGGPGVRGAVYDMATGPAGTSTLYGEASGDIGGDTLSIADINKDGFDDVCFAEPNGDAVRPSGTAQGSGELLVIFGGPRRFPLTLQVATISSSTLWPARRILGADSGDLMGYSMEAADLNMDGFA